MEPGRKFAGSGADFRTPLLARRGRAPGTGGCLFARNSTRALPSGKRKRYRNALLRVTIALAVGLAFAPLFAAAASPSASPSETPAQDAPVPGGAEGPSRVSSPSLRGVPQEPFSESRTGQDRLRGEGDGATDTDSEIDDGEGEDGGPGTTLRALSCLEGEGGNDQDGARRGVQKRDFLKKRRFELSALGGYYASDALSSTYVYGGALSFFPSEDFGVEVMVARNPVAFRLEEAFSSFDKERHFASGAAWNFLGAMLWSPVHAKLRWSERHITHADLLLVAGGGHTAHESVQGITFQAGIGLKLYLARFASIRFDVRDLMVPQEVLGQGRNTHNLVTMMGVCLWVPG